MASLPLTGRSFLRSYALAQVPTKMSIKNPLLFRHTALAPQRSMPSDIRTIIYLPTILQPSFWKSLVPNFLRSRDEPKIEADQTEKKKTRGTATFYIWMFLLIGSQSVQMLSLRSSHAKYSEDAEAKLSALREVVKRIQEGEDVDVETMLGTGNAQKEREWEEVLKELEEEDRMFRTRRQRKRAQKEAAAAAAAAAAAEEANATPKDSEESTPSILKFWKA